MHCPFCNHEESKVTDSRSVEQVVRRRRECLGCLRRFTTFESIELSVQVHKRDGHYEDYEQEKLIRGLDSACRHTKVSRQRVKEIASQITAELIARQVREIEATELGEMVMNHLEKIDTIAYIRFACVYRRFQDMDELKTAIENIGLHDHKERKDAAEKV